MLNVHRLTVLHAVVTEGSVTGAAAELNYTPSAISQHVAALERETGTRLLERVGRRVRPTPAGALLAGYAGEILSRVADAEAALGALTDGRTGRIRLASFGSAGTGLVPPAVAHFRRRHPEVDLQLTLAEQPEALSALRSDQADLVVVILDLEESGADPQPVPAGRGLDWHPLLLDPYFAALPCDHPLAALPEVSLARLGEERMVSGDGNRSCPCSQAFLQVCAAAGFRPQFAIEVGDYPTVQSLVAAGLGAAAIPLLGLSPAVHDGVTIRPLVNPSLTRRIFAVSRTGRTDDPLIAAMLQGLQTAAGDLLVPDAIPAAVVGMPIRPVAAAPAAA
ncbi:MAG TPA: LysR substrate-binding domain-containing protein [Solirubrobacteraceae bacterium]|jgi:DNA-binding transcriptional LysR family regulator